MEQLVSQNYEINKDIVKKYEDTQSGIDYLRKKLKLYQPRVVERYLRYDMKKEDYDRGIMISNDLKRQYKAVLGWCSKAVDCLADRLVFKGFDNDPFDMNSIFNMNNPDVFFDSAILNALIASCSFVYVSKDDVGDIRLQVIDAANATGTIDPVTGLLKEGYAILKKDKEGHAITEAYFEPYKTTVIKNKQKNIFKHSCSYASLVPIIHRPDAVRPFGRSRITKACEYHQTYAKRTLVRSDITAEFYSFPQKYILGMSSEAEQWDNWKATISSMLRIDKDSDGDKPVVGQFTTPSMSPFTEQLRTAAAGFAGESGLTLDDLGFVSDNPSSSDAIKASHETLRVMGKKAQRCFSSGFLNVGYVASSMRDEFDYDRSQFYKATVKWDPVFESDASTLNLVGDGLIKLNQAIPGFADSETVRKLTGLEGKDNG